MTVYDYACAAHGVLEVRKPMADAGRAEGCPACGLPMRRVWTAPVVMPLAFGREIVPARPGDIAQDWKRYGQHGEGGGAWPTSS